MTILEMVLLAIVQGLTEFLPVSSDGHLVFAQSVLGFHKPTLVVTIILHLGTLAAVLIYFRRDLAALVRALLHPNQPSVRDRRRVLIALVVGTIPAVILGLAAREWIEGLHQSPRIAALGLLVTAVVLLSTLVWRRRRRRVLHASSAWWIGVGQALAMAPGISRSGMTIASGLHLGLEREEAARFSFLLSIPAIAGAAVLESASILHESHGNGLGLLLIGFAVSFVVGFAAIAALMRIVRGGLFGWFGVYCLIAGIAGLLWF